MTLKSTIITLTSVSLIGFASVSSAMVVFDQDFDSANGFGNGGSVNLVGATESISSTHSNNWSVHHKDTNYWAGGLAHSGLPDGNGGTHGTFNEKKFNPNMMGNVLGHTGQNNGGAGTTNYNNYENSFYHINNIDFTGKTADKLTFEFDSWIQAEDDVFAVAWSASGQDSWNLLNPTSNSQMKYRDQGLDINSTATWSNANDLTGYDPVNDNCGSGGPLGTSSSTYEMHCGFDGWDPEMYMAGNAIFDLSGLTGSVDLRFVFVSDQSGVAEGINIDKIKITADMPPPPPGVPEPATLGLVMLGATALYRRRKT